MLTDTIDKFLLDNSISLFGITGTFTIILIGIIAYLSFKLGKKQVADSYNTNRVQCTDYTNEMEKKRFSLSIFRNDLLQWKTFKYKLSLLATKKSL